MRGYYLILHEDSFRRQDGIGKKMRGQIETFREAGLDCEPYFFARNREMRRFPYPSSPTLWRKLPWRTESPATR